MCFIYIDLLKVHISRRMWEYGSLSVSLQHQSSVRECVCVCCVFLIAIKARFN